MEKTLTVRNTLFFHTVRAKTAATAVAVVAAVALPQLFHAVGAVSGLGTALGETFLPMHLPVLLIGLLAGPAAGLAAGLLGLLAGPAAGLAAGLLGPLVSFALSGMPSALMLPFIMVELAGYGLVSGLLAGTRIPSFGKLLIAQVAGRALRSVAVLAAVYGFGSQVAVASIWTSIITGVPGILLQWTLLPLLLFWIERGVRKHG